MPEDRVARMVAEIADLSDEEIMTASRVTAAIVCTALERRGGKKHDKLFRNVMRDAASVIAVATGAVL